MLIFTVITFSQNKLTSIAQTIQPKAKFITHSIGKYQHAYLPNDVFYVKLKRNATTNFILSVLTINQNLLTKNQNTATTKETVSQ